MLNIQVDMSDTDDRRKAQIEMSDVNVNVSMTELNLGLQCQIWIVNLRSVRFESHIEVADGDFNGKASKLFIM